MTRAILLAVALLVLVLLRRRHEPAGVAYHEPEDGIQPGDPYPTGIWQNSTSSDSIVTPDWLEQRRDSFLAADPRFVLHLDGTEWRYTTLNHG